MKEQTLTSFCEEFSQIEASKVIGCSQSAVSQMIRAKRDIRITFDDNQASGWYEIKTRPSPSEDPSAA